MRSRVVSTPSCSASRSRATAFARVRRWGPWAIALALLPACKFKSIETVTGSMDVTVEHVDVLDLAPSLCVLTGAVYSDPAPCDDQADQAERLRRAVQDLSAYGGALAKLAGVTTVNLGAAPGAVIKVGETASGSALSGGERKAIETASKILARVLTTTLNRRALRKAVWQSDQAVQCLAWRGVEAAGYWRRELARIDQAGIDAEALDVALSQPEGPPASGSPPTPEGSDADPPDAAATEPVPVPPAVVEQLEGLQREDASLARKLGRADRRAKESQRVTLRAVQVLAADYDRDLAALERGLWAVALSHNHLACERKRLGTMRDKALRAEIERRVACVLERDAAPAERSAACREVLAWAETVRAHACEDLEAAGDAVTLDRSGTDLAPHCPAATDASTDAASDSSPDTSTDAASAPAPTPTP